jgi:pyruvate dehydrogenase E1 component
MNEVVDGQYQKYTVESGAYIREHFFGVSPTLKKLVEGHTDEQLRRLARGGHDPEKVFAAYQAAMEHRGSPTVILAKTVKGYGLGEAGEGRNVTHQQKKLNEGELREFRTRFGIPINDREIADAPFYVPPQNSPEMRYLADRRKELGGFVPQRVVRAPALKTPPAETFAEFNEGSGERAVSTTMVYVRLLSRLLKDPTVGKLVVPIIPDEARTFGMESLFRQVGIYSHVGQKYEPVDRDTLLYYREARDGQILEEGITEAGSLASFTAAGTAFATHGVNTIPFFIFYSMFGFQRVGDLIWAAADARARGFLLGATAGRTTLNGEGLQHQDGHSQVLASTVPNVVCYDPAFAYELALIIEDGIRRMYEKQEPVFYYVTLYNENYPQPPMPKASAEGILRGLYPFQSREASKDAPRVQLLGSGPILREVLRAQALLAEKFGVSSDVWSATSYKELRRDALACDRWNRLHPGEKPRVPWVRQTLEGRKGPFIASSDYMKLVPDQIAPWVPGRWVSLGTDGFGRSDSREALRRHFEVDAETVALAALRALAEEGRFPRERLAGVVAELGLDPEKLDPVVA